MQDLNKNIKLELNKWNELLQRATFLNTQKILKSDKIVQSVQSIQRADIQENLKGGKNPTHKISQIYEYYIIDDNQKNYNFNDLPSLPAKLRAKYEVLEKQEVKAECDFLLKIIQKIYDSIDSIEQKTREIEFCVNYKTNDNKTQKRQEFLLNKNKDKKLTNDLNEAETCFSEQLDKFIKVIKDEKKQKDFKKNIETIDEKEGKKKATDALEKILKSIESTDIPSAFIAWNTCLETIKKKQKTADTYWEDSTCKLVCQNIREQVTKEQTKEGTKEWVLSLVKNICFKKVNKITFGEQYITSYDRKPGEKSKEYNIETSEVTSEKWVIHIHWDNGNSQPNKESKVKSAKIKPFGERNTRNVGEKIDVLVLKTWNEINENKFPLSNESLEKSQASD
ncbi:MAG: hypothetical protein ACIWVG_16360 [Gloeotrichia echinulata HAB0833]